MRMDQSPRVENTAAIKHERAFHILPIIDQRSQKSLETDRFINVTKTNYKMALRMNNIGSGKPTLKTRNTIKKSSSGRSDRSTVKSQINNLSDVNLQEPSWLSNNVTESNLLGNIEAQE